MGIARATSAKKAFAKANFHRPVKAISTNDDKFSVALTYPGIFGPLVVDVAGSILSAKVIAVQAKLTSVYSAPCYLRRDNGPKFVGATLLR